MRKRLFHLCSPGRCGGLMLWLALAQPLATLAQKPPAVIRISGSSTVFPLTTEAIRSFRSSSSGKDVRFDLKETGTSAGFRDFCAGRVPISNASRPINSRELKACAANGVKFIELPIAFDAITVTVNPKNAWATRISPAELSVMWNRKAQGRIMRWNQVNSAWPAQTFRLCGPGKDSGTYDFFNKAINGSPTDSRTDYTGSEDDAVLVKCVANDPKALGYFGYGWYVNNRSRLKALAIQGPKGAVLPSQMSVQNEEYRPLSRPLFIYINDAQMLRRPEVRLFVVSYLQKGLQLATAAQVIPLPGSTYRLVETKFYRRVLGTSFGGDLPVGLSIGQALSRSFAELKKGPVR